MAARREPMSDIMQMDIGATRTVRTSPERTVFIEDGEADAWIATDLVVDLRL